MELGGGVRPEENLGVAGMRIYSGVGRVGFLKHPETSEHDRNVQSSVHCFNNF